MKLEIHGAGLLFAVSLAGACASVQPPSVRVADLHVGRISLTGAALEVGLFVRNSNPRDIQIERFEYEIKLNGRSLGRGFQPQPMMLNGFQEDKVVSRLDLSFLKLPGAVKDVLDQDHADAEIKGFFYLREGSGLKKLRFGARGNVDLKRGRS